MLRLVSIPSYSFPRFEDHCDCPDYEKKVKDLPDYKLVCFVSWHVLVLLSEYVDVTLINITLSLYRPVLERVRTRTRTQWTRTWTRTPPRWTRTQALWTRTLVSWTRTRTRTPPGWTRTHSESR